MERYYGKKPIIYTTVDFYQAMFIDGELSEYPIWIRSTKHRPSVKYGNRAWHFWQYQSDGWVRGIPTRVDRNAFYGDTKDWQTWLKTNGIGAELRPAHGFLTLRVVCESDAHFFSCSPFSCRRVRRHCGADQILEGGLVDRLALAEVDGAPRIPFQTGIEQVFRGLSSAAPRAKVSFTTCL